MIMEKTKQAVQNKTKEDEAAAIMKAAQDGDLKAMNKIQQAIKPETGKAKEEVTVNDYLKAVLYKRLGLDAMALDIQNKIIGKDTKFGQVTLGGSNWEVETNTSGQIIRAKDDQGTFATTDTLNKLRAGAQKFGSQAFGFTGESATIPVGQPDAGQEYRQRTNSVSGAMENIITTGPNAGKTYGGPPGAAKSVGTSYSKALNDAYIKFQTAPTTEMAKKMMEIAGQVDSGDGKTIAMVNDRIRQTQPQIFNQITSGSAGTPPAPVGVSGGTAAPATSMDPNAVARVDRSIAEVDREIARATQSTAVDPARKAQQLQVLNDERNRLLTARQSMGGQVGTAQAAPAQGGGSLAAQQAAIGTQAAVKEARLKPPATKEGEIEAANIANQNTANEAYGMIQPVASLIKQSTGSGIGTKVDKLAGFFGVGTKGADAIAQLNVMSFPFMYSIPRFEGPQGEKDVAIYEKAAGDFANPEKPISQRLAALQGMVFMLKKYDKAGTNDWTYGGTSPAQQGTTTPGTTSSGNKFKKVQ